MSAFLRSLWPAPQAVSVRERARVVLGVLCGLLLAGGLTHALAPGALTCADIMSRELVTVEFGTPLQEAWTLMRSHRIKALPVLDRYRQVLGIVTLADFMRHANLDRHDDLADKLRALISPTPGPKADKPEVVGQIMTRRVRVASPQRTLAELVPILSSTGHHHIPVIDDQRKLVGILTQTDLVRALVDEAGAAAPPGGA
jgi:CBS domain-containing membrane protein